MRLLAFLNRKLGLSDTNSYHDVLLGGVHACHAAAVLLHCCTARAVVGDKAANRAGERAVFLRMAWKQHAWKWR